MDAGRTTALSHRPMNAPRSAVFALLFAAACGGKSSSSDPDAMNAHESLAGGGAGRFGDVDGTEGSGFFELDGAHEEGLRSGKREMQRAN